MPNVVHGHARHQDEPDRMTREPLQFEGREVPVLEGDTVASALFRAGVRTFSRSLKTHRRRGLYCGTGECPNCTVTIDGVPGVRSCVTPATGGMRVRRDRGWPSAEHDLLHAADFLHPLMPVGFLTKTFIRPRFAWPVAERLIRRTTGSGPLPVDAPIAHGLAASSATRSWSAGTAGLSARSKPRQAGHEPGDLFPSAPCPARSPLDAILGSSPSRGRTPISRSSKTTRRSACSRVRRCRWQVRPSWWRCTRSTSLSRPARPSCIRSSRATTSRASGSGGRRRRWPRAHGVPVGRRVVVVASTVEGMEHLHALVAAGTSVIAAIVPAAFVDEVPRQTEAIVDGELIEAHGRGRVRSVHVREGGERRRIACDTLVLSMGLAPRDEIARMAVDEPVEVVGDAALEADEPRLGGGYLCLCEDVAVHDLDQAWAGVPLGRI
jgi:sarcosine oxidase subunit alpha